MKIYNLNINNNVDLSDFTTNHKNNYNNHNIHFINNVYCCRFYYNTSIILEESQTPDSIGTVQDQSSNFDDNSDIIKSLNEKHLEIENHYKNQILALNDKITEISKLNKDSKTIQASTFEEQHVDKEDDNGRSNTKHRSTSFDQSNIQQTDFLLLTKTSQDDVDAVFLFRSNQQAKFTIPDNQLNHLKSSSNRDLLVNVSHLTYKLLMWDKIYKLYFKSIFKLISKLHPISNKYFKDLNAIILTQDSLRLSPALNMLFNYKDTISKVIYGYANGLHEMTPFISSKYHKINIDYQFKTESGKMSSHIIKVTWYVMVNDKELKYSASADVIDSSYEFINVQTPFSFLKDNSMFNNNAQNNVNSTLYHMNTSKVYVNPMQKASSTRETMNSSNNAGPESAVNVQGFSSRMIVNGDIYLDFSDTTLFNSLSSLLAIDYIGIDQDSISESEQIEEILIYIGSMIQHFAINRIYPTNSKIRDITCNINIERSEDYRNQDQLHSYYKELVRKGDIIPITPVQFDFYFYKNTIKLFSEYAVLSSMSNITINSDYHTALPYMDKVSRNNFYNYAKNRTLLSSSTYLPKFVFEFQNLDYKLTFDELIVEMYVKTMLTDKIPDYIPLITRGDWGHNGNKSLNIITSYINDNFMKFNLNNSQHKVTEFISDIICDNKDANLGSNFKRSTRLTKDCPHIFSRFLLWQEVIDESSKDSENKLEISYLDQNNLDD